MTVTQRPAVVTTGRHTKDDGLWGPGSLTWRLHAEPTMLLVGGTAAITQMLHPRVMRMIDQASSFRTHPEQRAQRTGEYIKTITYGDVETAEHAAETLRRIHTRVRAVDPETGETYNALVPELLLWVHNTVTWSALRAFDRYGPKLNPSERDAYVIEQNIAARLLGVDLDRVPAGADQLDAYVADMLPYLAFTPEAVWFRDMVVPKGLPRGIPATAGRLISMATVGLMAPEHRDLYGLRWPAWMDAVARSGTHALFKAARTKMPVEKLIPSMRDELDVSAFGSRPLSPVATAAP